MKKRICAALIGALLAGTAHAMEPFVVKDIRVEGIQRTDIGTVFSYLPVKVGQTLDDRNAEQSIQSLYATGFFRNVTLERQGDVLIVKVVERPAIASITLNGIKAFSEKDLQKGLKQIGLAEGRILDRGLLEKAEQEIKRQYYDRGKYAVQVTTTVTPLERNRVGINFSVVEGPTAKIRQINIVGNHAYKEKKLLDLFTLKTPNWLSWFTKDDQYSRTKLAGDLEKLRSYYLDHGYVEFAIDSTQVTISPDKKDIFITINLTEGPQYTVSSVKLAGQTVVPAAELEKLITVKPGEIFSREKLTEITKAIGDRLGNDGYAFANVNAVPDLDKAKHTVAFTLYVDPGRRVYVKRINIAGNTKTEDVVIRRELRQMEGGLYNSKEISLSKTRLNRLGFFDDVNIETPAVPGATDQVDMDVGVKEKATGSITVGAGYASSEGLILSGSISQSNVFGTGNQLGLQVSTGNINKTYSVSYTNPYFTPNGVSLGYDVYLRDLNTSSLSGVIPYTTSTLGADTRVGVPINENDSVNFGLGVERYSVSVDTAVGAIPQYQQFVQEFGNGTSATTNSLRLSAGWARDTRNSFYFPTRGSLTSVGGEATIPPGSLKYYTLSLRRQQFFPLSKDFTLMLNGQIGYGNGYSGQPLPFFKNFFAGGVSSVRGYQSGTIGPKAGVVIDPTVTPATNCSTNPTGQSNCTIQALGGNTSLIANIELFFPVPGMRDSNAVRLSTFFDAGEIAGPGDYLGRYSHLSASNLRYSAGIGVSWNSPLGPLRFSIAKPINPAPDDLKQTFQFTLGTVF